MAQYPDGTGETAQWCLFIKEAKYNVDGCWIAARFLGGSTKWARDLGVKLISREKQKIHLCHGGRLHCLARREKGQRFETFAYSPVGVEPPEYVEKPMMKGWRKLYQEVLGKKPDAPVVGAGTPGVPKANVPDRVAALKSKLAGKRGHPGEAGTGSGLPAAPAPAWPVDGGALQDAPLAPVATLLGAQPTAKANPARKPVGVGEALALAAAQNKEPRPRRGKSSKKRRRKRSRSRSRRRRRRSSSQDSRRSCSEGRDSSSSSMLPPLQKKASKDPGSVLRMLVKNCTDALAQAAVTEEDRHVQILGGSGNCLSAYYQVVARPQMQNKVRDSRELETLARAIDLLRMGQLASLGDALAGRFLAVESASLTNSWQDAQHLEVIPSRHAGLAGPAVMLRAQRHTRQVEKASGRKPWRPSLGSQTWSRPPGSERAAEAHQEKGKGRGKGKKGRFNNRPRGGGNPWKDQREPGAGPQGGDATK